jgi:DNA repair protein RecN (Recombination protein N)
MLTELRIENFAIIQHLELKMGPGLLTFTGETGAGKSIILDAIMALVGGKVEAGLIRAGDERALVEGTFTLPDAEAARQALHEILEREELDDDPDSVTLGREIRRLGGRSVARVNGRSVQAGLLRDIGSYLVDIHGQSEHLSLLNVRQHIGLLDRFAESGPLLAAYRENYKKLHALRRELKELRQSEEEMARRADLLTFQAQEIEAAALKPGEEDELRHERDRLANAESLSTLARQSLALLDEGSPESPSISDLLGQLVQSLNAISRIDSSKNELSEQAAALADTLAEIASDLQDYLENIEFNPKRLELAEERLELIHNLKRKYGGSLEAVLEFAVQARQKLENFSHAGEKIAELEKEEAALLDILAKQAQALSKHRTQAAAALGKAVERELDDLRMAGSQFKVDLHCQPSPDGLEVENGQHVTFDETGIDRVEFLIAPNPGEGLKPLVKIASGGETSRLMLALKNVLVSADAIPVLIFDEIDQGIGGRVGSIVGEKLWRLGRRHQVLCVTHLPQLAAFGDQHWRVRKEVDGGRTLTLVDALENAQRLDELAQMLGTLSDASRKAAQEVLDMARQREKELAR